MGLSVHEDYIMRKIHAAVRILLHIIGLMGEAYRELLGAYSHLFSCMDSKAVAALLARPEKMAVMANLFQEEAEMLRAAKRATEQVWTNVRWRRSWPF